MIIIRHLVQLPSRSAPRWLLAMLATSLISLAGCATEAARPPQDAALPVQQVEPVTVVGYSQAELTAQFNKAQAYLLVDRFAEAAQAFDHLRRLAKGGPLGAPCVYHAALAYEGLGQYQRALARYVELYRTYPEDPITKNGLVRQSRVLGYLERWADLGVIADRLLERYELQVMDRIEALGAKALSLVEQAELTEAEAVVVRAEALIEKHRFGEAGVPPVQLAQVAFARGEITRRRSEQIKLVPVPPNFAEVLERRCQGLLDAQRAYTEAMRSRDAHWSAMSGYRIGELYHQLHQETMQIPPPAQATSVRQQQLFEGAMRLRYRILLEKGLKMMAATVNMAERTGEESLWVQRAQQAKEQLERSLSDEQAALAKMPYTEAELRAALDELKARAAKTP